MLYDMTASFEDNLTRGIVFSGSFARSELPRAAWCKILDHDVMRPIGVSACPLTATGAGVALCSQAGFDIIVWKTIRSSAVRAYSHPNVVMLAYSPVRDVMYVTHAAVPNPDERALANSIGNPSGDLRSSLASLSRARHTLLPGQILIASIYGTGSCQSETITDFVVLARDVAQTGVHALELNLSCPNVKGFSYADPEFVYAVTCAVVKAVSCPIVIKVGACTAQELAAIMRAAARAGARAIAGINSMSASIHTADRQPYFGAARERAGVSGAPIRHTALAWVRNAAEINEKEHFGLTIFGGGGITKPADFDLFLNAGATAAMTATGALYDISIAARYAAQLYKEHNEVPNTLTTTHNQHRSVRE